MALAAVGVAGVDHQLLGQAGLGEFGAGRGDARRVVVGRAPSTQHDVRILVAGRGGDGGAAGLGDGQEMVRLAGGQHRIYRDLHIAVGAVLEPDRAGEAGRQFPVHLAFGGAGADRAPGHQVGDVLRRHHVQELAGGREAQGVDVDQHSPGEPQAVVDLETAVQPRIVDQPLPADRRARLLEIDPHEDFELAGMAAALLGQATGVVEGGSRIVNRAGADHHQQAVVLAVQDAVRGLAGLGDGAGDHAGRRRLADHLGGRAQRREAFDSKIFGGSGHHGSGVLEDRAGMKKAARSLAAGGFGLGLGALGQTILCRRQGRRIAEAPKVLAGGEDHDRPIGRPGAAVTWAQDLDIPAGARGRRAGIATSASVQDRSRIGLRPSG